MTTAAAPATAPIALGDHERIAFIGDSITQQNLYAAFIETYLVARLPQKRLSFINFGWGGDVAPGGHRRFTRDAVPYAPTMVLVNFGMNDGSYGPPRDDVRERWLDGVRGLIADTAAVGARPVLVTTNAVDVSPANEQWLGRYNDTLGRFAAALTKLAAERSLPLIDLFTPFLAAQDEAKRADTAFTMIPDGIHPDPVGHLVMAWSALKRFDAPRALGRITATPAQATAEAGIAIDGVERSPGSLSFTLRLPFIPYWVPPPARRALSLVPFQRELNRFELDCSGWASERALSVRVDGEEIALLGPSARTQPLDLALCDAASWARQGATLWDQAQQRYQLHFKAWRELELAAPPEARSMPAFARMLDGIREWVRESAEMLRAVAQPRAYRIEILESQELGIDRLELSPIYPFAGDDADFDRRHPPETAPESVAWSTIALRARQADLGAHFGMPSHCVSYARLVLEAVSACKVRLTLGSDDGISVLVGGQRVLARNVLRGCKLGDDQVEVELPRGRTTILLRVTQGGGGYAVALKAEVLGDATVRQVEPVQR
jgi:lysophospholipase L1-like esterase